jgi:hypothetical protein
MQPAIYTKDTDYILSCTTAETKINAIQAIIDALYGQMLVLAQQDSPITEYMLSDGQTVIKSMYRTPESIMRSIQVLTLQMNRLINNSKGRVTRVVDSKNMIGRRYN